MPDGAAVINITSDAAVEPYEGWGGYGSSKAALDQLTAILAAEHPRLRVYAVDPGDMRTRMHQEAFPGEDISDRPPPEDSVPGLLALIDGRHPSGRYSARELASSEVVVVSALAFELPTRLEATEPPEQRGLRRDGVRLMVAERDGGALLNARFHELPQLLNPTICSSSTSRRRCPPPSPGSAPGRGATTRSACNFSTPVPRPRRALVRGRGPQRRRFHARAAAARARRSRSAAIAEQSRAGRRVRGQRSAVDRRVAARDETVPELLWRSANRSATATSTRRWPLDAYQNVYATTPGSAEMPSAGRPFTPELIAALLARGIRTAAICLHTGVSSPERHEPPFPERYDVPAQTARLVAATRAAGGRVIAVGTTVVRALESVVGDDGAVHAGAGWTNLVIDPDRELGAVDGLITGWHEPEASHLMMLEAIAGAELLERSYAEAISRGYLWHEFGDSHLILR